MLRLSDDLYVICFVQAIQSTAFFVTLTAALTTVLNVFFAHPHRRRPATSFALRCRSAREWCPDWPWRRVRRERWERSDPCVLISRSIASSSASTAASNAASLTWRRRRCASSTRPERSRSSLRSARRRCEAGT